jgi:hypothetical protein
VHLRALSDIEPKASGHGGADVRPDFNWNKMPRRAMNYLDFSFPKNSCERRVKDQEFVSQQ